jgi:hypothetical protein
MAALSEALLLRSWRNYLLSDESYWLGLLLASSSSSLFWLLGIEPMAKP